MLLFLLAIRGYHCREFTSQGELQVRDKVTFRVEDSLSEGHLEQRLIWLHQIDQGDCRHWIEKPSDDGKIRHLQSRESLLDRLHCLSVIACPNQDVHVL